ncbi:MAG: hypothetical protein DMG10_00790 [Acidobacteria bacterium]|nr:MAG: hypothetical protein DMG10_00790 [Acidobacteriota bacterium]
MVISLISSSGAISYFSLFFICQIFLCALGGHEEKMRRPAHAGQTVLLTQEELSGLTCPAALAATILSHVRRLRGEFVWLQLCSAR